MHASIDLNYNPKVLISTDGMDEKTWKEWRKKGIGGSDVAAIFNVSPFKTKRDLYYDKTNTANAISSDEDNWVAKEVGHELEDLVAKIFAKKTGYKVWKEKKMFYHPLYECMLADIDFMFETPEGVRGILECKTGHYLAKEKWLNGKVPIYYEYQVRHYLSVLNVNVAYIACLFGNNEDDFIYSKIERDLGIEQILITEECSFWNDSVLAMIPPQYVESADLALESIRKHFGNANVDLPKVSLEPDQEKNLQEYMILKELKKDFDKKSKDLKDKMDMLSVPIVDIIGQACKAECHTGNVRYEVTYSPRYTTGIKKEQLVLFEKEHPDLYKKYVSTTESRTFSVKELKVS